MKKEPRLEAEAPRSRHHDDEDNLAHPADSRRPPRSNRSLVARARTRQPRSERSEPRHLAPERVELNAFGEGDFCRCGATFCTDPDKPYRRICASCGVAEPMPMVSVSLPNGETRWMTLEEVARWPRV